MKHIVNILHYPESQSLCDDFIQQLCSVATNICWLGQRRLFDVEIVADGISFRGRCDDHVVSSQLQFITSYPYQTIQSIDDRSTGEWMSQFNTLVVVCDASEYKRHLNQIKRLRFAFSVRDRDNDCLLFLKNVDKVMTIGSYADSRTRELAVYSALTDNPFHKGTFLTIDPFLDFFNGESFCQYRDGLSGKFFKMPVNVLCHFEDSVGFERLLTDFCNRTVEELGIRLSNTFNEAYLNKINSKKNNTMSLFNCFGKKKEIRLAVIGGTANGKTYFIEDVCKAIYRLGFQINSDRLSDFGRISDFNAQNINIGKTELYFCRNKNLFKSSIYDRNNKQAITLSVVDVPGEVVSGTQYGENVTQAQVVSQFADLYQALCKCKRKIFEVQNWKNTKTVTYGEMPDTETQEQNPHPNESNAEGGMNENLETALLENTYGTGNTYEEFARGVIARTLEPAKKEQIFEYLRLIESLGKKTGQLFGKENISGKELMDRMDEFDADSVYYALLEACRNGEFGANVPTKINKNYIKYFRFYYFLYSATDVVLCHKVLNDNNARLEEWFNPTFDFINGLQVKNKQMRIHLGIKGVDTFMDAESFETRYTNLIGDNQRDNIIYSDFISLISSKIYKSANDKTDINPKLKQIDDNALRTLTQIVDTFSAGQNANKEFPPRVFFVATPIDKKFIIGRFITDEKGKNERIEGGDSNSAGSRLCFGTIQLLVSILKANGISVPESYNPKDPVLKRLEGIQ